jgi:formylglycine-generating enzyme required for sulfatase activity
MRRLYALVLASLLVTGCKSSTPNDGYAIDLTVDIDASVSDEALATAQFLDLEVSGDEIYSNPEIPIAGKFTSRSAGVRYKPGATSGAVTIALTLLDGSSNQIARGISPSIMLTGRGTQLVTLTLAAQALSPVDLATSPGDADLDLGTPLDMTTIFVPGNLPSCTGLAVNCGSGLNDSCCSSPVVNGGTYYRSYDVATDGKYPSQSNPATVSDFRFDRYEVTVGRFRKFVNAGKGTQASPPPSGAGANPYIAGSGWDSSWNASLLADTATLTGSSGVNCDATYQTWTASAGSNEDKPINCVSWFEAFAFCAWDQGFLPTEAEWNYAAAGGSDQRAYPWSNPPASVAIDCSYANYHINNPAGTYCVNGTTGAANNVGSESPKGDGKWGQSDLAGNVSEWNLDWYAATYTNPCADCANLTPSSNSRVMRGASFDSANPSDLRASSRNTVAYRNVGTGFRCARAK